MIKKLLISAVLLVLAVPAEASIRDVMEATCQLKVVVKDKRTGLRYKSGGTGTVFNEDDDNLYILTAAHVVDGKYAHLYVFFFSTGKTSHHMLGKVIFQAHGPSGKDVAVVVMSKKSFKDYPIPKPIPIATKETVLKEGSRICSCGCPKLNWPSAWLGHVVKNLGNTFKFVPKPIKGRSGSAVVDEDGEYIVGIIIQYRSDGTGIAVSLKGIYKFTEDLKMFAERM